MFRQEEERANDSWIIKLICIVARYDRRGREKRQGMGMGGGGDVIGEEEKKPSRFLLWRSGSGKGK